MAETPETVRLSKAAKELNVGTSTIIDFFQKRGVTIDSNPNSKITGDQYAELEKEFLKDKLAKEESKQKGIAPRPRRETPEEKPVTVSPPVQKEKEIEKEVRAEILIKDISSPVVQQEVKASEPEQHVEAKLPEPVDPTPAEPQIEAEESLIKPEGPVGPKILGKINIEPPKKKGKSGSEKAPQKEEKKKPEEKQQKPGKKKDADPKPASVVPPVAEEVKEKVPVEPSTEKISEPAAPTEAVPEEHVTKYEKLEGPKILGKMELPLKEEKKKPVASSSGAPADAKKKRKRIRKGPVSTNEVGSGGQQQQQGGGGGHHGGGHHGGGGNQRRGNQRNDRRNEPVKKELTQEEIDAQIKETLARLSSGGKSASSKYRREKRQIISDRKSEELQQLAEEERTLKVTEFISANEMATMMGVPVNQVIATCMSLGMFVSINQRLSAEIITIVAEEFGFKVEFVSAEAQVATTDEVDAPEDLQHRPPIVTVMGHVDHGKTSLLDYIRKSNVIAGEAGGITQHIGAYSVELDNGKKITFLDTPGHEAFTAMRARGAQVTDVVIIVVAADDSVMPQTREAINHAQAAGVPIVFAINKMDKPGANSDKIREELSQMNILVEEWGGKYQAQEVSAKKGTNIDLLLEKVLLEADMLDLKANPDKNAVGTVIESSLDKGRGYVTTVLIQSGTLGIGDVMLAGCYSGRVKAMFNERGTTIKKAGPSSPVLLLGLSGAPQAGDKFKVMDDEREARDIAAKRLQLLREQGYRTQKHITLDEIGRRLAIGDFQELNIIVKGDVDGSVEALTDSLLKLTTEKIQVNVIHKSVGQVTESDILLASASDAIIVAFQVRPSASARKLAEQEQIDIRTYSVIYDAINEVKSAMEGMLAPEFEEKITCNIDVREVFKISKVGSIAGCMVTDGKVTRNTKVRVIRDGIVVFTGELGSLKRFKDDVKEVAAGYECGLNINNFNDIKVGDNLEGFEMVEIKR